MNHQPHSAAEAADLITDWLTDDDLSDEEQDQQEDENLSSVVDAARQRQDRRLLSSSSDSYESSESSNSDSDISNSSFGSNANGASTHLGKDKTVWKNSPTSVGRWKNSCPQCIYRCEWCPQTSFAVYFHAM